MPDKRFGNLTKAQTKKEKEVMMFEGSRKKKKRNRKKQRQDNQVSTTKIDIDLATLAKFDRIGVQPPLLQTDIERTLQQMKEKREYYDKLPEKENEAQQEEQPQQEQTHQQKQYPKVTF